MVSYEVLTFQPGGYEPVGPERGHERSTWMTPLGPFEVEQEYGRRPADGRTLITGPAELQAALAWRFGRQRSYLRIGVELHLEGMRAPCSDLPSGSAPRVGSCRSASSIHVRAGACVLGLAASNSPEERRSSAATVG